MHVRFTLLFAFLTLLSGCASEGPSLPEQEVAVGPSKAQIALVDGRRLILERNAQDAMLELDVALDLEQEKEKAEVQFLRGVAALSMGSSEGNAIFFEDARRSFLEAAMKGGINAAWFGAARASWMQFYQSSEVEKLEQALEFAASGNKGRQEDRPFEIYLAASPERTVGEITFFAYTQAKGGTLPESRAPELFKVALGALEAEVGRDPSASWGWNQIANLYLWEQRREDARTTIASALALNPNDKTLHETQSRLAKEDGNWAEVIRVYELFVAEHQGSAISHWYLGRAYYDMALEQLVAERNDQAAGFVAAEREFRRARALEPDYANDCKAYEVICRDGLGMSDYNAGRLDEAVEAWWSMEDIFEGGLRWEVKKRLYSGLDSLAFALDAHNRAWEEGQRGPDRTSYADAFQHMVKAANIATRTFNYDKEDWSRANNAGFFNRDLGVEYERQGVSHLDDDEALAAELFGQARQAMEASLAAYEVAARLAPDDCRTVNDTGLILAYYLQRDEDRANQYFQDAIRVGLLELQQTGLDADQQNQTRIALGDAYQNLGVVALTLHGDAKAARPFFDHSLAYEESADMRAQVRNFYLPLCDKIDAGTIQPAEVIAAYVWGKLELGEVRAREEAMGTLRLRLAAN